MLRASTMEEAPQLADQALTLSTLDEIELLVKAFMAKRFAENVLEC